MAYVFRAILASRYPLEAHLSRAVSQQGVEPKLGWFSILRSVPGDGSRPNTI